MKNCQICNKEYKDFCGLGLHIRMIHNMSTKDYYDKFLKTVNNTCKTCGNLTKFLNLNKGYREYCSVKCVSNNIELNKQKIQNTDYIKSRNKARISNLQKYGVENTTQLKYVQNKMIKTCLRKYGVPHISQTTQFKNKFKTTCLQKYGVENPNSDINIKAKKEEYFLNKYGSISPFGSSEIQAKTKQTFMDRYGVDNPLAIPEIQAKTKQTFMDRYGVDNPSKLKNIQLDIKTKLLKIAYKKLLCLFPDYEPLFTPEQYVGCCQKYEWKCKKCSTVFDGKNSNRYILYCPNCDKDKQNTIENKIYKILNSLGFSKIQINTRKILKNYKELDFYIPEKNIAIEFNGNYWHSEISGEKTRQYHIKKLNECINLNIKLIQIMEDEWLLKNKIVINRLKNILGKTKYHIYARKCIIKEIDSKLKNKFLNKYHIQGEDKSNVNIGLFYHNRLIAVMTFSKLRKALGSLNKIGHYELSRYCNINNFSIVGGISKMLKYFEKTYNPIQIKSFADRRWSVGNMYFQLGFKLDHISLPNYWYTSNYLQRYHRFNFRKNILKNKLEIFDNNLSEWENMQLNGYDRIWDCGNLVFIKSYKTIP